MPPDIPMWVKLSSTLKNWRRDLILKFQLEPVVWSFKRIAISDDVVSYKFILWSICYIVILIRVHIFFFEQTYKGNMTIDSAKLCNNKEAV